MILYFSATGNCKYVASRIANATGEEIVSIVDCIREDRHSFRESSIGIISPTYDWGLPSIVKDFLEQAAFQVEYLYFIATYGTTTGAAGVMANKAIRGRMLDAYFSVRMPDTWTPRFDLSTPEKVAAYTKTTEVEIDEIIEKIDQRYRNRKMVPRLPAFLGECLAQTIYNSKVKNLQSPCRG